MGLVAFGATEGNFEAKNSYVANVVYGICPELFCGENSEVYIKNCKADNVFQGIYSWVNTSWNIMDNEFKDFINNGISINTYNHIYDLPPGNSTIKDNLFILENSNWGILGVRMYNLEVKDNLFEGNGYSGFLSGGEGPPADLEE